MNLAIFGYGNIGKGVESVLSLFPDIKLYGIFSRRDPATIQTQSGAPVFHADELLSHKDKIDVLIMAGGSATDLPIQTPKCALDFNVVDSFDTHAKIPEHFKNVDEAARKNGHVACISAGWDPGLFSLNRVLSSSILPDGENYTFWGRGVSQGHSDAIRRIEGVLDARQYTVPIESAKQSVLDGNNPVFTARQMHKRDCYVVVEEGADKAFIEQQIKTMPNYFADYETSVTFISMEELKEKHAGLPHGGSVIRSGKTGDVKHSIEFKLNLESNPKFTSSVLVCCARAVYRMYKEGMIGCKTMLDIPPAYYSDQPSTELYAHYL